MACHAKLQLYSLRYTILHQIVTLGYFITKQIHLFMIWYYLYSLGLRFYFYFSHLFRHSQACYYRYFLLRKLGIKQRYIMWHKIIANLDDTQSQSGTSSSHFQQPMHINLYFESHWCHNVSRRVCVLEQGIQSRLLLSTQDRKWVPARAELAC